MYLIGLLVGLAMLVGISIIALIVREVRLGVKRGNSGKLFVWYDPAFDQMFTSLSTKYGEELYYKGIQHSKSLAVLNRSEYLGPL